MKLFQKRLNQNEKLIKNIERYEKKKAKQQKSKILGQEPVKREANKEKNINVHNTSKH